MRAEASADMLVLLLLPEALAFKFRVDSAAELFVAPACFEEDGRGELENVRDSFSSSVDRFLFFLW